ncbi:MAG TPA: twin-arginine translocase TatA/TatE family subunit [Chlorobaculum parvum]|uniref:Sec-independent protein translocase protein TatA n=1 Tax=Chlorobaculum parvum TaxID=274539 RepID=A0A7C5DDA1_9CHLB|nr:twin-arginine translocase TatA/TatE family subunit [Chlorobaculum parvum]
MRRADPALLLVLAVILVLFGGQKIPELARGLGKGIKEFKKAQNDIETEFNKGGRYGLGQSRKPSKESSVQS